MTPSELKLQYYRHNPSGHYFDRSTMRFFGDTMANYKVIEHEYCWELARKRAVVSGLRSSHYFSKMSFKENPSEDYFNPE